MLHVLLLLVSLARAQGLVDAGEITVATASVEALDEAREALAKRDFERAATLWGAIADAGGGARARAAQAVALYEAGELGRARAAAEQAIALDPGDLVAGNVLGLALVDGGRVAEGLTRLDTTRARAEKAGQAALAAQVQVNRGLALLDQGDAAGAKAAFTDGLARAQAAGDGPTAGAAQAGLVAVAGLGGTDTGVGAMLGKGQVAAARAEAERRAGAAVTRREKVNAALDLAAVARAEGRLDAAAGKLDEALRDARASGMRREVAMALGQLGLVHSLAGRYPLAADALRQGAEEAQAGGYRVIEVDLRCELGMTLVHLDRLGEAEEQQRAAGALLARMGYAQGVARQAELGGAIAAARGDTATASAALSEAVAHHERLGRSLDAARVATQLAAAWQARDPATAEKWATRAKALFAAAGDPLGPAHLSLARALADAKAKRLPQAMTGFAEAAKLAEAVGSNRGKALAVVARENAAQTLVMLGSGPEVARMAAEAGIEALVARQAQLDAAFGAYEAGLAAYGAGNYADARQAFTRARQAFEGLGEGAYAARSRRAAAWAQYNAAVSLPTAQSYPVWAQLVEETTHIDDPELYVRVYGASALAAHTLGQGDPGARLVECARMAERQGLRDIAARCHGAIAERPGDLATRAKAARTAHGFAPGDPAAVYALYVVAVDAFNEGDEKLARELATLARPAAGALGRQLDEILAATGGD